MGEIIQTGPLGASGFWSNFWSVLNEAGGAGFVARNCGKAGDGPLCPGDPGGESHEPETGKKAGKIETTPFGNRKNNVRNQNCHFSRTDPINNAVIAQKDGYWIQTAGSWKR